MEFHGNEFKTQTTLQVETPFVLYTEEEKGRLALPESCQAFEIASARPSGLVSIVIPRQPGFSGASIRLLIVKPTVITEPVVPRARLLSVGPKLYPSNMQGMLKYERAKERFCWQGELRRDRSYN